MKDSNRLSDQVMIEIVKDLKEIAVLVIGRIFDERSERPPK